MRLIPLFPCQPHPLPAAPANPALPLLRSRRIIAFYQQRSMSQRGRIDKAERWYLVDKQRYYRAR